ncbi:MFS transporter [Granulicella cerasi]|uniref:MFS transporter n=1 Tax=Granulicella cerasi TaxID=741063 RepID=A0ABW1Z9L0_9BACT|nr:MFS transporter [Granulicella cerasi]
MPVTASSEPTLVSPSTLPTDVHATTAVKPEPWFGAFLAGLSGWTLDAFDFFLVVLSLTAIGREFHQDVKHMIMASSATLLLRPIGAFLFGGISDRYGRKLPLVINLCLFSVVEMMTGFAHTFTQFIVIRALFGVVMGGQWGIGVSLAMEKVPTRYRGVLSGLLQQGYAIGFLLAAAAYFFLPQTHGWRPLFFVGSLPALASALFVALRVKESKTWQQNRSGSFGDLGRAVASHWKLLVYFTLFMMAMHMSSHGTQDMYPTFLEKDWGIVGKQKAALSAISMVGAILGGLSIGWISDRVGRKRAMIGALVGGIVMVPLWSHAHTLPLLVLGAVLMQFCVQGAWGVVPAHVAELSPDSVRGTLPGLGNQIGVALSGAVTVFEAAFATKGRSYATSMAMTAAAVFALAILMVFVGRERRSVELGK